MGRGSSQTQRKMHYIKVQTKWKKGNEEFTDPWFVFSKKDETTDKIVDDGREREFSGYLLSINHGSYIWKQRTIKTIQIILVDNQDAFKLEMGIDSNMARSVVNRLLSTDRYGFIIMRLYMTKPDADGNQYPNMFLENDGAPMEWAYEYETDIKPLIEYFPDPQNPEGKKIPSHVKINNLLLERWTKHEEIVRKNAEVMGLIIKRVPPPIVTAPPTPVTPVTEEDIGFPGDGPKDDAPDVGDEPISGNGNDDLPF